MLSIFTGDGLHRLLARCHLEPSHRPHLVRRAVYASLLTWFPLLLLTVLEGNALHVNPRLALGDTGGGLFIHRRSFALDLAAASQFLGFFPLAFFAESFIGAKIRSALERLRAVVPAEALMAEARRIERRARLLRSEAVLVPLAYLSTWSWASQELTNGVDSWHTAVVSRSPVDEHFTWAGYYATWFALPLFTYVWMRWVWKIYLWTTFLWRVSKMELRLHAAHPDRTGGLGCLSDVQTSFASILFGTGLLFSAAMIHKIVFEATPFSSLDVWGPIVVYIFLAPAVFIAPLFLFTRTLARAKRKGLAEYGAMATAMVGRFERRWFRMDDSTPADILRSPAPSALADFKTAFETVQEMRVVPFDRRSFLELFSGAATPFAPIVFFMKLPDKVRAAMDLLG